MRKPKPRGEAMWRPAGRQFEPSGRPSPGSRHVRGEATSDGAGPAGRSSEWSRVPGEAPDITEQSRVVPTAPFGIPDPPNS